MGSADSEWKRKIKELKDKVDKEEQNINFNTKMVTAYNGLVKRLDEYVRKLPIYMSSNLSEKIKNYYNRINEDDADFELIEKLQLPVAPSEKLSLKCTMEWNRMHFKSLVKVM